MTRGNTETLPKAFCWTRFGVEAGQDAATIFARKEIERRQNGGVFLWGVGNSVLPSLPWLLHLCETPKAVFSPIRSRPRAIDVAPGSVAVWSRAREPDDTVWPLPAYSLVTSHSGRALGRHYALVCRSNRPLQIDDVGPVVCMSELTNLRSGRPIGASQVTAIVRHRACGACTGPEYRAAMIVDLAPPYVVALEGPVVVPTEGRGDRELLGAFWQARDRAAQVAPDASLDTRQYDLFA